MEQSEREIRFGEFRFFPERGMLLRHEDAVRIGSRALALLGALAARPGQFVSPAELMKAGWPDTHVDDSNLRVQMSALRKTLDDRDTEDSLIANAPGRGYALRAIAAPAAPHEAQPGAPSHGLPSPATKLIGRAEVVAAGVDRLPKHRCVTLVGPGGIGKTRVAIEIARTMAARADLAVCFVDLAPLASGELVAATAAAALTPGDTTDAPPEKRILHAVRRVPTLLVLDNCEHILDTVASLAALLLNEAPDLRILATSREPLLIDGEATIRLAGLEAPPPDRPPATVAEALAYPAIELLAERAAANAQLDEFDDSDVEDLVGISHRLDGIPLAIELAAARVEAVGLPALAKLLDKQFSVLGEGRRTALPRHRTLTATLEWSFGMLSQQERDILVALSVFQGEFTMDAALAVAQAEPELALKSVADLVTKSLIMVGRRGTAIRYRLLETTRSYCADKLASDARAGDIHRDYANDLIRYLAALRGAGKADPQALIAEFRAIVADVRNAIDWGLKRADDPRLGVKLVVESSPVWLRLSMLAEYARTIESAIDLLSDDPRVDDADLIWLAPSLHKAWYNAFGLSDKVQPLLIKAAKAARKYGDIACELDCLWTLFGTRLTEARYAESLDYARQFGAVAATTGDVARLAMAERILAISLWRGGDFSMSMNHGRNALRSKTEIKDHEKFDLVYRQGVASRANMTGLLWLRGQTDAAIALAHEAIALGLSEDLLGLSYGLSQTIIPLAFWIGDLDLAESHAALLIKIATDNDFGHWVKWGRTYRSAAHRLRHATVESDDAIEQYWSGLDGLHRHILATILPDLPGDLDAENGAAPHWCSAELLRVAGLSLLNAGDGTAARAKLQSACDTARRQGGLGWELRAVNSLAMLDIQDGRPADARQRLDDILPRIAEGAGTADVKAAKSLLAQTR